MKLCINNMTKLRYMFFYMNNMRSKNIIENLYAVGHECRIIKKLYTSQCENHIYPPRQHQVFIDYAEYIKRNDSNKNTCMMKKFDDNHFNNLGHCEGKMNFAKSRKLIEDIDKEYGDMIKQLTPKEILEYLIFFIRNIPEYITSTKFYIQSIDILKIALKRNELNHHEILIFLYFAGLTKKSGSHDVKYIVNYLPLLHQLSLIEQSIVAHTLFKCAIKFSKIQTRYIEKVIEENSELLVKNKYWLVPLCKAVRQTGPSQKFTMKNLSQSLINAQTKFSLPFIAHVVSLYAEAYLKQMDVLTKLFNEAFLYISTESSARIKDVDRILWSARTLNYPLKKEELDIINTYINKKFEKNKFQSDLWLNIFLSLWMYEYQPKEKIKECFKRRLFVPIVKNEILWKLITRLNLLVFCIKIEAPDIEIPDEIDVPNQVGLKIDKNVRRMFKMLNIMQNDLQLSEIELNCPINGINLSGISAKYKEKHKVHIDFLDESTCLRNLNEPHGLMNLKLRLLPKIGYQSILVSIKNMETPELLQDYLKKHFHE
ncbi:hypothetical protein PV327_008538 [Microctonus hyperodae]|uniref:Uncharacterized protein n=1 Tax=Microctonus hyperodae TaxID=165561 RepID=A0AA39F3D4_MICHY|nr:hypothetical protein PV327_008538 [Microctonus hyperodae]